MATSAYDDLGTLAQLIGDCRALSRLPRTAPPPARAGTPMPASAVVQVPDGAAAMVEGMADYGG